MGKKVKIQFTKGLTHYNLDKFPFTWNIVANGWDVIREAYNERNKDRKLFAKLAELTVTKESFEKIQKELGVTDKTIYFCYNHKRMFSLCARKEDEENTEENESN